MRAARDLMRFSDPDEIVGLTSPMEPRSSVQLHIEFMNER